ncbi:MAG TPA: hypothetical protein VFA33_24760 [Bryobacteraceae bacterium]|nr:hypothetical protein [Bryobacteraceae bacterium]
METVARLLAALPPLRTGDVGMLSAVRTDLARAIASGQDAGQLASDLSTPAAWLGLDLRRAAGPTPPTAPPPAPPAPAAEEAAVPPPAWAVAAAQAAVQAKSALRVAVLDRDPASMPSLRLPAWAQGQQAVATYGPLLVESAASQITFQKWLIIYIIPVQMVSFVQGATTLFIAPLAATGSEKTVTLAAGSVWVNVTPLAAGAPANSFAGVAIQSGSITSDRNLTFGGTTVTIPAGATVTLAVTPAAPAASGNPAVQVAPPATITFTFPGAGAATASVAPFTAQICGETFDAEPNGQPLVYNDTVKTLAIPCDTNQTRFAPVTQPGTLAQLHGTATLLAAGWALQVTQAAPPALGNAAGAGIFYLGFTGGLSVQWTGLGRPEPEAGGILLASSGFLLLWTAAGLAPFVLSRQEFDLWDGQLAPSTLTATRFAGSGLVYEIAGTREVIELGAVLSADLDRPLMADGSRAIIEMPGLVTISSLLGKLRLFAYGAFPPADVPKVLAAYPNGFPLALDNAFLKVSVPLLLAVEGKITPPADAGAYVSASGALLVGFLYQMEFPFLPDPYTTGASLGRGDAQSQVGGLLGEVAWLNPGQVALRMIDLGHAHPLLPPAAEASSDLAAPAPQALVLQKGSFQLGQPGAVTAPSTPPVFPFHRLAGSAPGAVAVPQPLPAPAPAAGFRLLDVSTRASLLGVEVIGYNFETAQQVLTIDGLSARTSAVLAPVITLPSISWEPMYNQAKPVAASPTDKLLNPPNDGPMCGVGVASVTLVPVSPIQSLGAILAGTQVEGSLYGALLTLPFGLVAGIAQTVSSKGGAPAPELTQPSFEVPGVSGNVTLTGAYQLTMRPPQTNPNAPLFSGKTYTRTLDDNPPWPNLSYGEEVMGLDVGTIFFTRFNNPGNGVPVKRYDLTGYGASLFTDWTNLNPPDPTDIIQVDFDTTVGRTSHEVIQAQSVIYPWGIKVVRTITIDRLNSGSVERTDSGWIAASDGHFVVASPKNDFQAKDVHAGVIDSLLKVKNITEFGVPLTTPGTFDWFPPSPPPGSGITKEPATLNITLQPVTFDADIAINPQHTVMLGGSKVQGLDLKEHTAVASTGIVGYIGLTALYHLSLTDLLNFLATLPPGTAGGPIPATLDLGGSHNVFRCVGFSAAPAQDTALGKNGLVIAAQGLPKLPQGSAWSVALKQTSDAAPHALPPTQPIPVVQPNDATGNPGKEAHFADPSDIFRLAQSPPAAPQYLYGFLQDVTTQKSFLAQPYVTHASQVLSLRQTPSLADPGVLLGAVTSFPALGSALPLTGLDQLASNLGEVSLAIDKWFDTFPPPKPFWQSPPAQTKITHLINTSVATVDLVYRWRLPESGDNPPTWTPPDGWPPGGDTNAMIHITLGQPTGPTWSIDIYQVALVLTLPGISSTPALWIEGSFHADSESPANFPDLQVFYDGPLQPITKFFSTLQTLGQALGFSDPGSGGGLNVHFADGALTIQETFNLGTLPLGPGEIQNISLDMGGSIDLPALNVDYLIGIGSPDNPVHWIVDPMSGTGCLQAGVQDGALAVLVQLGIGLGLAIDLGIASGSASIVIAFQVQITGAEFELLLLLTGQAQVDVLGGLASCSITISVGLGLEFALPPSNPEPVTALGTASVAIHLSICWIISIDWSGSWSFSHQFSVPV